MKEKFLNGLLVLFLAIIMSSCTSRVHTLYSASTAQEEVEPFELISRFQYDRAPIETHSEPLNELSGGGYEVSGFSFPSIGKNGQSGNMVSAHYYRSENSGAKPLIIILPIWGSYKYPSTKIGKGIRRRSKGGVHVLMLQGESTLFDWDEMNEEMSAAEFERMFWRMGERIRYTSMDVRRIIDWAETQPEIDSKKISLVGFSMGAIVSSLAVIHDQRFHSAALIMGGANLDEVVITCHGRLELLRDTVMPRYGWTMDQMQEVGKRAFGHVNPSDFPGRVDPAKILFIDAAKDKCMPQSARDAFWNVLGEPERISYNYGHHGAFLAMTPLGFNLMRRQIYRFLESRMQYGKTGRR